MARKIFLAIVCVCLVGACGRSTISSSAPSSPVSSVSPSSGDAVSASAAAAAPGCGTYCQQAGNSAGNGPPGYPCPASGCSQCPPQNCVTLESDGATASSGVATVKLSCNLSSACHGAFLVCLPSSLCQVGATEQGAGGRLAGSDFTVPAGTTSDVNVMLTNLGEQVASGSGGFNAAVIVDLLDYGPVINTTNGSNSGSFNLTSSDAPTFPDGATASCGGTVFVGPGTSCPFAENVAKAYSNSIGSGDGTVSAGSPVTGEIYQMQCTGVSPHVCRGGTNAFVEFYS